VKKNLLIGLLLLVATGVWGQELGKVWTKNGYYTYIISQVSRVRALDPMYFEGLKRVVFKRGIMSRLDDTTNLQEEVIWTAICDTYRPREGDFYSISFWWDDVPSITYLVLIEISSNNSYWVRQVWTGQ